jgi:Helix-turn-helix domain
MKSGEQPSAATESRQSQSHRREHIATRAKIDAVLRVLAGESVETLSRELGVTVHRIERWKNTFIEGGTAELSKKKDVQSESWVSKHASSIQQWMWLLFAMIIVITLLVLYAGKSSPE